MPKSLLDKILEEASVRPDGEELRQLLSVRVGYPIAPWAWAISLWGPRVLVAQDRPDEKIGSIHIPGAHQEPPGAGWIIKLGPDVGSDRNTFQLPSGEPNYVWVGRKVLFTRWAGVPLMQHTKADELAGTYLVMNEADIFGTSDGEDGEYDPNKVEDGTQNPLDVIVTG